MTLPLQHIDGPPSVQQNFDQIAQRFPINAPDLANGTQGTVFPSSPTNGQEFYYVADATNGVVWHFKYRAASANANKWEFVGGPPLFSEVVTWAAGLATPDEATASNTYVALTTAGPLVTLPLAGDYDVEIACRAFSSVANTIAAMSYDIGGTGAVDVDALICQPTGANSGIPAASMTRRKTGLAAVTLTAKYRAVNASTVTFRGPRTMKVTPVRVLG